jgi:hypothetical protein
MPTHTGQDNQGCYVFSGKYFLTNDGKLFNKYKKELKTFIKNGYKCLKIKERHYYIHRLVALTYIPNPDNKPQVNHIDGNKLNNNLNNLEWVTVSEQGLHAYKIGLNKWRKGKVGKRILCYKNDKLFKIFINFNKAASFRKVHTSTIWKYCNNTINDKLGYKWKKDIISNYKLNKIKKEDN